MSIHDIRRTIDDIDLAILSSVSERMRQCTLIKLLKSPGDIEDRKREQELRQRWTDEAAKRGVNADMAIAILELLMAESKRLQSL